MHKPFDPFGWDYARAEAMFRFKLAVSRSGYPHHASGGKAIGLELCDQISSIKSMFHVPAWYEIIIDRQHAGLVLSSSMIQKNFILRSNAQDEDWESGASGEHESVLHRAGEATIKLQTGHPEKYVVQNYAFGVGVIIDIAWSDVAGGVIGRVSTGRILAEEKGRNLPRPPICHDDGQGNRFFCTSATEDGDGLSAAWLLESGQQLCWNLCREDSQFFTRPDWLEICRQLKAALDRLGIDFGVQCELRYDPWSPEVMQLVQIRPTPDLARGRWTGHLGEYACLIANSAYVNGAFDRTSKLVFSPVGISMELFDPDWRRQNKSHLHGKIISYCSAFQRPAGTTAIDKIEALRELEILGIITHDNLGNSTQHYALSPRGQEELQALHTLAQQTAVIRLTLEEIKQLKFVNNESNVRLVSDGLIGRLYLV